MTSATPVLDLTLYDAVTDTGETFLSFRTELAGSTSSNFEKIDTAYGTLDTLVANTKGAFYLITAGTDTYTVSNAYITSYFAGLSIIMSVANPNTGAATLNISSLGAKDLKKVDDSGSINALVAGDLVANKQYFFVYDGTRFVLVSSNFYVHGLVTKVTIADSDEFPIADSDSVLEGKKVLFSLIKSTLKTYFDGIYQAVLGYTAEDTSKKDATGGYAGLTLFKINFKNAANTITSFFTNANTSARTYTFPDKDLTVAGIVDVPVKATGAELDTGTDNDKFSTPKALKDSHNVPSIVPSTIGNKITSDGTDWVSTAQDGWISASGTWTPRSQAYTNDPAPGASVQLNMGDTSGFYVEDIVVVSSSAGSENGTIISINPNVSMNVGPLALDHTTSGRLVKLASTNLSFVVDTSSDLSGILRVGNRIKFTDTTVKYFILTGISGTRLTLYGGTDYAVVGSAAVTSPSYSQAKSPYGFPTDVTKWTISYSDTSNAYKTSPTGSTWYNLGVTGGTVGLSVVVPPGQWRTYYSIVGQLDYTTVAASSIAQRVTLSTTNSSESSSEYTTTQGASVPIITGGLLRLQYVLSNKIMSLSTKTRHYLNSFTGVGMTTLSFRGDLAATILRFESSYL